MITIFIFPIFLTCNQKQQGDKMISLPKPKTKGSKSLEEVINSRRSVRQYSNKPLSLAELSQLLWSGQGITSPDGHRTAPSAGATYPLELLVVVGNVEGLSAGIYRYQPSSHSLVQESAGDKRKQLSEASLSQDMIAKAPISIVITAIYERTTRRYGERGIRYVHNEVGHVSQNISLQAEAIGLKTVVVGAFQDEEVAKVLGLSKNERPLYIMPVGK